MPEISRTLVKSAPELWAELSDAEALGRHLEAFGTLTITATQPEEQLSWDAERAGGTIRLEPAGFGTRLTLDTELKLADPPPAPEPVAEEPEPEPEPEPVAVEPEPEPEPAKRGFWARMFQRKPRTEPLAPAAPEVVEAAAPPPPPPPPPPEPEPEPLIAPAEAEAALATMLDALGTARHRPFSRA